MSNFGRAAFGSLAQQFAQAFPPDEPIVVFDHTGAAEALAECARRRFANEPFFVRPILPPEDHLRANAVAAGVVQSFRDRDERRVATQQAFDGTLLANGRPLRDMPVYPPPALRLMQAAVRLSDGIAVSSHAERSRVQDLLKTDPSASLRPLSDRGVPFPKGDIPHDTRDAVVIWAARLPGDTAMPFAVALADIHAPIVIVSQTPPQDAARVRWVAPDRSSEALSRARVIVDTNPCNADSAAALARWNAPLVADAQSGARERIANVRCYDRSQLGSIFEAVTAAYGLPPAQLRSMPEAEDAPPPGSTSDGPLVSIVIPTFDRPVLLRYALESCRRQTYKNLEVIVAVGGGKRYDELCAEFPHVRFIHLDDNVPAASMNAAYSEAAGEYVAILNDDDLYFPNHVELLVSALERSGAMVAHGDVLTAFLRGDDAQWDLYGFESNMARAADPSALLVANYIGAMSGMIRRSSIGSTLYDMKIPLYRDYALWLRLAQRYDFIHVERITSCYTIRNHGMQQQTQMTSQRAAETFRAIYDAFPVEERPHIEQQRAQQLQTVAQSTTFTSWSEPAGHISPVPWPPF